MCQPGTKKCGCQHTRQPEEKDHCGGGGNCGCGHQAAVYHCDGTCGYSDIFPGECASNTCTSYHKPFTAYNQCAKCKAAVERDNDTHWCAKCVPLDM